jgi:hypothetical protein
LVGAILVVGASCGCKARAGWTVLPAAEAARFLKPCARSIVGGLSGSWVPGSEDIAKAEVELRRYESIELAGYSRPNPILGSARRFYHQYAGFIENRHQVIFANVIDAAKADWLDSRGILLWRKQAAPLCDSALCSFEAVYDVASARLEGIHPNLPR